MQLNYDAILLVSFGGPEKMEDVLPFLETVTAGKHVSRERILQVKGYYELFGGVSPINSYCRYLVEALGSQLAESGCNVPIYWGNRNWHPFLTDTIQTMADDGIKRALAFVTSAYSSYSSCRQYIENIESARQLVGPRAPLVDKIKAYYNKPYFIEANVENVSNALAQISDINSSSTLIVFTGHSIPVTMARSCRYEEQLIEVCGQVAAGAGHQNWKLVFQSRSGHPSDLWLEPDIIDFLRQLKNSKVKNVVVAPIGFICEHMETIYSLDMEAALVAKESGLNFVRAATPGMTPKFISMVKDLILERINPELTQGTSGIGGSAYDNCPLDCCRAAAPSLDSIIDLPKRNPLIQPRKLEVQV